METRKGLSQVMDYIPQSKYSLTKNSINKYSIFHNQCQLLNDKYYLVYLNPYENENLNSSLPIYNNVNELNDGIYIFVILGFNENPPSVFFLKTFTLYEIGTKHHQLIHRIVCENNVCKKYNLYYAGELIKQGSHITFNFYSGTFKMETKIKKKELPMDIQYVSQMLNENNTHIVDFSDTPIITSESVIFTEDDLQLFKSLGASIYEFDNKEKCKKYLTYFGVSPLKQTSFPPKLYEKIMTDSKKYGGKYRYLQKTKKRKILSS
jgi:hypothetical protein